MRLFGALGGIEDDEIRATFNGGLGMVVVVAAVGGGATVALAGARGIPASIVGEVVDAAGSVVAATRRAADAVDVTRPDRASACRAAGQPAGAPRGRGRGAVGGEVVLVFADRACPALDWAAEQGIDTASCPGGDDATLAETLPALAPDAVVLAGYLRLVGPAVPARPAEGTRPGPRHRARRP